MELDEPALVAAMAGRCDESAAPEIPDPDHALHGGPDVSRPRLVPARRVVPARRARLRRVRELLPSRSASNAVSARSWTAASSPFGMAWPSMSFASLSFSSVPPRLPARGASQTKTGSRRPSARGGGTRGAIFFGKKPETDGRSLRRKSCSPFSIGWVWLALAVNLEHCRVPIQDNRSRPAWHGKTQNS